MSIRSQDNNNEAAYLLGATKDLSQNQPVFARLRADKEVLDQQKQNQNLNAEAITYDESDTAEAAHSLHVLGFKGLDDLLNSPDTLEADADVESSGSAGATSLTVSADESGEVDADAGTANGAGSSNSVAQSNESNAVPMSMAAGIIMAFLMMIQFANEISQQQNELAALWAKAMIGISETNYPAGSTITAGDGTTIQAADGTTVTIPPGTSITVNASGSITVGGTTYPGGSQLDLGNGSTVTQPNGTTSTIPEGALLVIGKDGSFSACTTSTLTDSNGNALPGGLAGMWYANGVAVGEQQYKQSRAQMWGDIAGCAFAGGSVVIGGIGWGVNSRKGPDAEELADAQARVKALDGEDTGELHARGRTPEDELEEMRLDGRYRDVELQMDRMKLGTDTHFRAKGDVNQANTNRLAAIQLRTLDTDGHAKALKAAQKKVDALTSQYGKGDQAQNTFMNFLNMTSTAGQSGSKAYADGQGADASADQAKYKANSDLTQQVFSQVDSAKEKATQQAQSQHDAAQQSASQMLSSLQAMTATRA